MAHYKNVIRDPEDYDAEIGDKRIFILDEREKFDTPPTDLGRSTTIKGPKILVAEANGVVTAVHKLRSPEFWSWVTSCTDCKPKRKQKATPKPKRMEQKFVGRSEDGIS